MLALLTENEAAVTAVVSELRTLPHGLDTPVRAGILVADVLRAAGWSERTVAAIVPEVVAAERAGVELVR